MKTDWTGAWSGMWLVLFSILLFLAGELSTLYIIIQYAFLLSLAGLCLAYFGWKGLRVLLAPLVYLVFMIPLPDFLQIRLSSELQLISSILGVEFIRLCDISVFLQGNVIDHVTIDGVLAFVNHKPLMVTLPITNAWA